MDAARPHPEGHRPSAIPQAADAVPSEVAQPWRHGDGTELHKVTVESQTQTQRA